MLIDQRRLRGLPDAVASSSISENRPRSGKIGMNDSGNRRRGIAWQSASIAPSGSSSKLMPLS
jgi:hypothetical protein